MGTNQVIIASVLLVPLIAAIANLFFWGQSKLQRILGSVFVLVHLFVSVLLLRHIINHEFLVLNVGGWLHGYGIMLAVDSLSAGMIVLTSFLSVLSWFYSSKWFKAKKVAYLFNVVFFTLQLGLIGAFMSADLFNLYVWFEVMLVSSFVLLTLGGRRFQLEGAIKYVAINVFSSTIFLAGVGMIYGLTGTVNMAAAGLSLDGISNQTLPMVAAVFFLVSFGIKAAIFPLFFWLPASYHTPPIGISSLLVALMTKVGIYTLIRFFTIIFPLEGTMLKTVFMVLSGLTMVVGVFGAAAQTDFRRILSFHIVSQIGYMLMGLAIGTPLAIAGALFFILHNVLVKTNLFFISGLVGHVAGTYNLKKLGGVFGAFPIIALVFAVSAFSLTGVPPLTGFWSKFMLAKAGFVSGDWAIVVVSLFVSMITLFSMTKIWNQVFWKLLPEGTVFKQKSFREVLNKYPVMLGVIGVLTLAIIGVSFFPANFIEFAEKAAGYVVERSAYINHVLNL
ncbi:MAG: pH regulation protein D [Prolixibacteraceae bacterium]|nr:pH regulation protein D [Prolixibacteraceae bacterium]MBN2648920.1 pH regulation protein D [Prolixibacteraceae bacterium]